MKPTRSFLILMLLIADASMNLADQMDQMDDNSSFLTNLTNASVAPTPTPIPTSTEIPSASPVTIEEKCENTLGWTFGTSILYECDDDFVWCSDPGAMENCCKCKPICCGLCNTRNHPCDLYQPCKFAPTMRPTGNFIMPTPPTIAKDEDSVISIAAMIGIATLAIFLIVIIIVVRVNYRQRREIYRQRRDIHSIRRTMSERRRFGSLSGEDRIVSASFRFQQIASSFFFETVLPDKSNANAQSIRSIRVGGDGEQEENDNSTAKYQECEEDESESTDVATKRNSLTPPKSPKRKSQSPKRNSQTPRRVSRTKRNSQSPKRDSHTATRSLRNVFASWRKPSPKDDCCICLDGYSAGEVICLARSEECDHVFHKDCLLEWIKDHDCCPLCRADLVK